VFKALRGASETIHSLRGKVLRESEDEIVDLIMMVARKVIIREVAQERVILADIVKNAVAGLSAREEITVRINSDDYTLVTTGRDEVLRNELVSERFILKPDPTVVSGFCKVDTDMGTIDATIDAQLEEIYRNLLEQRTAVVSVPVVDSD
jgi:flagellar assembly protein FliH